MSSWQQVASQKQASVLAKIPSSWHLPKSFCTAPADPSSPKLNVTTDEFLATLPAEAQLSPRERAITSETDVTGLLSKYEARELTAEEVITAFCHRAAINHQMTESLAEVRFDEAIAEAKIQDEYVRVNGKLVGPLHGIPISLKDQLRVEGLETSMGYIGWLGKVETAETESLLTKQIKSLGGVIIAKTHVPQSLMIGEAVSNLHAPGTNPHNRLLAPGGSSGGEGSLLSCHGSLIGLGTDQGGSIRIPAAFNNLFGLKPSYGRLSYKNMANSLVGKPVVPSVVGPMSTTIENLIHFTKAVIETEGWRVDPALLDMPWRASVLDDVSSLADSGSLCFAVLANDGVQAPHPTIARGIQLAVDAVRRAGHKVIEWLPPSHSEGSDICWEILFAEGYDVHDALKLSGEPLLKGLEVVFGKDGPLPSMSLRDYYELMLRFRKYQDMYAEYWESTRSLTGTGRPVDGLIVPVAPHAAVRHNSYFGYNYTTIFNLLDYAAVTVPVTFADKDLDKADPSYKPINEVDEKNWKAYDAEIYHGAPIGVQVVGRRLEEEKVLALGKVLHDAVQKKA